MSFINALMRPLVDLLLAPFGAFHPLVGLTFWSAVIGIGALYVRRRPRVRLDPLFSGGGQERGLRSGTLPGPLAIGLGEAAALASAARPARAAAYPHGDLRWRTGG